VFAGQARSRICGRFILFVRDFTRHKKILRSNRRRPTGDQTLEGPDRTMSPQTPSTPMNWKTREMWRLVKCVLWTGTVFCVARLLGFQPSWQLAVLVVASAFIDSLLDAWLPTA
jgi:hypothetical protein